MFYKLTFPTKERVLKVSTIKKDARNILEPNNVL